MTDEGETTTIEQQQQEPMQFNNSATARGGPPRQQEGRDEQQQEQPMMEQQQQQRRGGGGRTRARHQLRRAQIRELADIRPALHDFLYNQNIIPGIELLEQKTGIERDKIFYGLCTLLAAYLVVGPGNGFLCNMIGFAYPAYMSVIAIRTVEKDDDTQWLVYWTTFGTFSVIDSFAGPIYNIFPLYWLAKAAFLLYLALPQTLGAHNLYVKYVDPLFDRINDKLREMGIIAN